MSEREDDSGRVIEKEYFIKFIKTNYEFRFVLGVSYIGKCDIRIVNDVKKCILDIIPDTKQDSFKIFKELCGNDVLIQELRDRLSEIDNTTYKQLYIYDLNELMYNYLQDIGYKNFTILNRDYYE